MNEQKKLTPEEIIRKEYEAYKADHPDENWLSWDEMKDEQSHLRGTLMFMISAMEEYASQQTAALREELEAEQALSEALLKTTKELETIIDEKDARIKELEDALEVQKCKIKEHHDFCARQDAKRVEQLEAVKKENKEWKDRNLEYSYQVAVKSCVMWKDNLDEAVKLLKEIEEIIDYQGSANFPTSLLSFSANVLVPFLSRLSSHSYRQKATIKRNKND